MTKPTNSYRIPKDVYVRSWSPISSLQFIQRPKTVLHFLPYFIFSVGAVHNKYTQQIVGGDCLISQCVYAPYSRSLIIRGIGYRLYPLIHVGGDVAEPGLGYVYSRYIYLRAGHSFQTYCGVPNGLGLRSLKRERKLVIYGFNESSVATLADRLFYYRPPNAFTGRGIRFKKVYYKRKPGKRAQKGRGF